MTLREEVINLSENFNSKEPLKAAIKRGDTAVNFILDEIYKYRQDHKLSDEDFINGMKYVLKVLFPHFNADEYEEAREKASAPTSKKEAKEALKKLNNRKYFNGKDDYKITYFRPKIAIIKQHYNKSRNAKYKAGISHIMSSLYSKDWLTNKHWMWNFPPEQADNYFRPNYGIEKE